MPGLKNRNVAILVALVVVVSIFVGAGASELIRDIRTESSSTTTVIDVDVIIPADTKPKTEIPVAESITKKTRMQQRLLLFKSGYFSLWINPTDFLCRYLSKGVQKLKYFNFAIYKHFKM